MELWGELLSDSTGIMSALVIALTIVMAIGFIGYFVKNMGNDKDQSE